MLYGVCLLLFALAAWQSMYWVSMAILFVGGINFSLYLVGGLSVLQELVPDGIRGRVMGLYGATWSLGPLGMAQAGFVAQYLGAPLAVAIGAWGNTGYGPADLPVPTRRSQFPGPTSGTGPTEARV